MKLEYLHEFLSLSQTKNYSLTAEELFISTSTLSRHIILLEEELGVDLFIRGPRTVVLSKEGELFCSCAEAMIKAKETFDEAILMQRRENTTVISVGFSRPAVNYGVLNHLLSFRQIYENIDVKFCEASPTNLLHMLRKNECDFIITYKYVFHTNSEYMTHTLVNDRLAVAINRNNSLSTRKSLSMLDLRDEKFLIHDKTSPTYTKYLQMFQEAGVGTSNFIKVESAAFIMDLIAIDMGIGLVGQKRYEGHLPENVVLVPFEPETKKTLVMTYKNQPLSPINESFLNYIKSVQI